MGMARTMYRYRYNERYRNRYRYSCAYRYCGCCRCGDAYESYWNRVL